MSMKTNVLIFVLGIILSSCAKVPISSINLMNTIQLEGKRMHELNTLFVNKMFDEKRNRIDTFIIKQYTPVLIENFVKKIPEGIDYKSNLPKIIASIIPKINARRDSMQNVLESNRIKIIDKLNTDYFEYDNACVQMTALLSSAVKLEDERKRAIGQLANISKNKIDFEKLGNTLDGFIQDAGSVAKSTSNLNTSINEILKK